MSSLEGFQDYRTSRVEGGINMEEGKQEEKTYTETEYKGIIKDLQSERSKRQETEFQLSQSKGDLDSLRKTVEELKNSKPTELVSEKLEFEGKDDDYATVKEVKKNLKRLEKEAIAKTKAAQKAAKTAADYEEAKVKYDNSCRLAEDKYSRLASVGLDFKTVYQKAIKRIGNNKYEQAAIFHSKNPGEKLYKIGCEDPEIKAKLDLEENQELLNSMDSRKVDKDGLKGGKVKDGELYTFEKVQGMTTKQIMEHLPEIQKAQKKWKK